MHPLARAYLDPSHATHPTLWSALRDATLDPIGVRALLRNSPALDALTHTERTCFSSVRLRTHPAELPAAPGDDSPRALTALTEALALSLSHCLTAPGPVALALSGGLDAALLLALARALSRPFSAVYTLAPAWPTYDESPRTRALARALSSPLIEVPASESDFVHALPDAVRAAAEPLYNMHPVARVLLARRLAADGIHHVVTGDGADQVFSARPSRDWTPLVRDLALCAGVTLHAPFLDDSVRTVALTLPRGEGKPALRALARTLLPAWISDTPKHSSLAPAMDLSPLLAPDSLTELAPYFADAPTTDATDVRRTTLALLLREARRPR